MSDNTIALSFGLFMVFIPVVVLMLGIWLGRHDAHVSRTEADEFEKLKSYADALNARCIEDTATVGRITAEQAVMRQWIAEALPVLAKATADFPETMDVRQLVDAFCNEPHMNQFVQAFIAGARFVEREYGINEDSAPLRALIESGRRLVDGGPDDLLAGVA